jgi:uncharacterized repeat protein (TIGR04138 family)
MSQKPENELEEVIRRDGRYPLEAFAFLHEGLARAVKEMYGQESEKPGPRHVDGRQLCRSLRQEALERWGLLAPAVLARWNIRATLDFGQMVYLLVNNNLMQKTDTDSLEDFRDVYPFETAFRPGSVFHCQ